jgi:hypothetical protein
MTEPKTIQPTVEMLEKRRLGPFSVSAIGLGAMRLAGPNVFGPPRVEKMPLYCFELRSS